MSHYFKYNKTNVPLAQNLRKNMTKEERKLWYQCLSLLPVRAHRQKNIGNYIVDFYISTYKLAVELDGSQHKTSDGIEYDKIRDAYLNSLGISVVRYDNSLINHSFDVVVKDIIRRLGLDERETMAYMNSEYNRRKRV